MDELVHRIDEQKVELDRLRTAAPGGLTNFEQRSASIVSGMVASRLSRAATSASPSAGAAPPETRQAK